MGLAPTRRPRAELPGALAVLTGFAQRRPVVVLLVLAIPVLQLQLANSDASALPSGSEERRTAEVVEASLDEAPLPSRSSSTATRRCPRRRHEVFLLSRIKEEWDRRRDDSRAANDRAVLEGITATGPVVTAAAVCTGIVFALGELVAVKEIGVGMTVAVLLDVTVVRGLLLRRPRGSWDERVQRVWSED